MKQLKTQRIECDCGCVFDAGMQNNAGTKCPGCGKSSVFEKSDKQTECNMTKQTVEQMLRENKVAEQEHHVNIKKQEVLLQERLLEKERHELRLQKLLLERKRLEQEQGKTEKVAPVNQLNMRGCTDE